MKLTPKQARAELVKALRSGDYKQARSSLRSESGHCCLGVACDVYRKIEGEGEWNGDSFEFGPGREGNAYLLPKTVMDWLGFTDNSGAVTAEQIARGSRNSLTGMNDTGATFDEIADFIEIDGIQLQREA